MTITKKSSEKQPKHSPENIRITFNMAWPSIVESFFTAFAGLVDSLMVSSLGSYAVAAVGLTTPDLKYFHCFHSYSFSPLEHPVCRNSRPDHTAVRFHAGNP